MAKLGDICKLNMGQSPASTSYNNIGEGLPFFQGNADFGELHPNVRVWCSTPIKIAKKGDILISVRAPIGALNIADRECCIGRGLASITADETICNKKYLWYGISSKVAELNSKGTGSTFKAISKSTLEETQIPLINLQEQQNIAEILDKVTGLISLRKQQLAKLDELVKSQFVELFGDPEKNTFCWKKQPLLEHLNVIGGYAFKSEQFSEEGIPVLRIGNINSGFFKSVNLVYWEDDDALSRYKMYPGDLVMSLTGTVGKDDYGNVCILGNDYAEYYLNQRNAKLELQDTMSKYYLSVLLKFEPIKKKLTGISRGVRQANISNKDILNLSVPIPPIELQKQFATFVEQTDKSKLAIQKSLDQLELLKKALMQNFFG